MKASIDIANFVLYFNLDNIKSMTDDAAVLEIKGDDFRASLFMKSEQNYKEDETIEFILRFEHYKDKEHGAVIQKEFSIEHHPADKSTHTDGHVQIHIHGPAQTDKVGKIWITLPLKSDEDYDACIKGFIHLLKEIIEKCEPDLAEKILNFEELGQLIEQRKFLISKINESLKKNHIEFKYPSGKKIILSPKNLKSIIEQDISLIPLFEKQV